MDPVDFVLAIPFEEKPNPEKRERVIAALKLFYCRFLAEDPYDGSDFDLEMLTRIQG